jgi:hypothetical protein
MSNFGIDSNMVFDVNGKSVATRLNDHDTSLTGLTTQMAERVNKTDLIPSILSLGAYNDGTHPNETTAAFQQAINNGGFYRINSGTYVLNAPLTGNNFLFKSDGKVTIYVDHSGDFIDLTGWSSQTPFIIGEGTYVAKRNTFVKTGIGINQTGGNIATDVGANLTLKNVTFNNFDVGIKLQGMNWAKFEKVVSSSCNIGLYLNGLGTPWASNNGNIIEMDFGSCGTGVKMIGDALGNDFKLMMLGNTLAFQADETGYAVQGIINNKFRWVWCEQNTNDFELKNGRLWTFFDLAHVSNTYFFTPATNFVSCTVQESSVNNLSSTPLKGLMRLNSQSFPTTTLDRHAMSDLTLGQRKEQTMVNLPTSKTGHISTQMLFNPIIQMGTAKQNFIGYNIISACSNAIHETLNDATWSTPSNSGSMTSGQLDPFNTTNAYKFIGSASDTRAHFNLNASSGGRTFTFQILAKAVNKTENPLLILQLESGTEVMKNDFVLNKDGWQLYFITLPFVTGEMWMNAHINVTTTSGILLANPCLYESDTPGLAQKGNTDGLVAGENVVIENGSYKVYRTTQPASGYWWKGDTVINTSPASGGTVGWICTGSGSTPVWKTFGSIQA